ncbi:permease [Saccharomonospora piscinae]|uniref:Permease n=1 Tax=Saccharomonospora piscinae TaxID=687388 RepID=A0A1V9AC14_SACPI|nr:permease [Saccharomonospora piscinae]OQO94613.1 permease [Saccharomonospora piscinae]
MPAWRRSSRGPAPALPWRAAPKAALSSPLTLVAAAITTLLSCFLAVGAVLHSSAAGGATLDHQAATVCPDSYGPVITQAGVAPEKVPAIIETVERHAAVHGFGTPTVSLFSHETQGVEFGTGEGFIVRLGYRDGGTEQLTQLRGDDTTGLWVGRDLAGFAGIGPGDRAVNTEWPAISGVYTDLYNPAPRWWCSVQDLAVQDRLMDPPGGAVVFATDRAAFDDATRDQESLERLTVTFPAPAPRTLADAEDSQDRAEALLAGVRDELRDQGIAAPLLSTPFARSLELARQAQSTVTFSILPLAALSVGVGLLGAATVGLQWYHRRHAQVRLHSARGHGPVAVGSLAAAELGGFVLAGGIAGAVLARVSAPLFAPPGQVTTGAQWFAAGAAMLVLLAAMSLLVLVVAVRTHREFGLGLTAPRRRRGVLPLVPWELLTAAVALWGWSRLPHGGGTGSTGPVPETDPLALIYPVAVVLTVGLVTARLAWWALRASHRLRWWSRPTAQWAVRRLAHARGPVTGVLIVAVLAVGTLTVGSAISSGQQSALAEKSGVFVGSESRTDVENAVGRGEIALPGSLRERSTVIGTVGAGEGTAMVFDPDTFTRAAYTEHLPDATLTDLLARLDGAGPGGAVPVIAVGDAPATETTPFGEIRAVGRLDVVPVLGGQPGYLVPRTALDADQLDAVPRWAVLSTATVAEVGAALRQEAIVHMNAVGRAGAFDALPFYVVEWTFGFVALLGVVLGVAAALAMLVAMETRRRQNTLTAALARRMGLRRRALWGGQAVELGTVAGLALAVGLTCGVTVAALSVRRFDPARWLPPGSGLPGLAPLVLTVTACGLVVVGLACWIAVRSVRTARVAELLRE